MIYKINFFLQLAIESILKHIDVFVFVAVSAALTDNGSVIAWGNLRVCHFEKLRFFTLKILIFSHRTRKVKWMCTRHWRTYRRSRWWWCATRPRSTGTLSRWARGEIFEGFLFFYLEKLGDLIFPDCCRREPSCHAVQRGPNPDLWRGLHGPAGSFHAHWAHSCQWVFNDYKNQIYKKNSEIFFHLYFFYYL